jgi:hypothetical protein
MLSGMLGVGFVAVFMVLCFTAGGPLGASITVTRWVWRLGKRDPFPVITTGYWLSTTASFPAWPAVKALIAGSWGLMVVGGVFLLAVDAVKGPKETRTFIDQYGRPTRITARMKHKRVRPQKLDKAVRAITPARDRLAYSMAARRYAQNEARAEVGLPALKESRLHRKLVATLPTGKTKEPKMSRKEKIEARRDARARVSVAKNELPPPPPVSLAKGGRGPKAGVDPAAPPAPPAPALKDEAVEA